MELNYQILKSLITKIMVLSVILSTWATGNNLLYSQNKGWILPSIKYVVGQNPALSPLPTSSSGYSNQPASSASNMQLDSKGNILFFVVDDYIYDKDEEIIGKLQDAYQLPQVPYALCPQQMVTSEITVAQDPGDCNRYS